MAFDTRQPIDQSRVDGTEAFDEAWQASLKSTFLVQPNDQETLRSCGLR